MLIYNLWFPLRKILLSASTSFRLQTRTHRLLKIWKVLLLIVRYWQGRLRQLQKVILRYLQYTKTMELVQIIELCHVLCCMCLDWVISLLIFLLMGNLCQTFILSDNKGIEWSKLIMYSISIYLFPSYVSILRLQ